ncbi:hypothetical protein ACQ4PT_072383 [Festuca glaucescens]
MAVFEVDPLPWLPWGHQIIDGGPTRLPRTYYYAVQDPPVQHQSYCISTVDPPPPPQGEAFWREQFPEIGWDAVQDVRGNNNEAEDANWNQLDQMDDVQHEEQESMIINLSDSSGSSVNMMGLDLFQQQQGNVHVNLQVLNFEVVYSFVGPAPPPEMQWNRLMDRILPLVQSQIITAPLQGSPFGLLGKLTWDKRIIEKYDASVQNGSKDAAPTALVMDSDILQGQTSSPMENREVLVSTPKRKRARKSETPVVQLSERRFTRSCLSKDGYRPKPLLAVEPKIKKKPRAKMLLVNSSSTEKEVPQGKMAEEDTRWPRKIQEIRFQLPLFMSCKGWELLWELDQRS